MNRAKFSQKLKSFKDLKNCELEVSKGEKWKFHKKEGENLNKAELFINITEFQGNFEFKK